MRTSEPRRDLLTRRALLDWFLGTSACSLLLSIVYPVARYLSPPRVPESTVHYVEAGAEDDPELREKGYRIIRFGSEPVILIRVGEGDFRAFSATCTHLDCIVEYQREQQRIWCNCHNGEYDIAGRNVAGPPPRPLERFQVNLVARGSDQAATIVVSKA